MQFKSIPTVENRKEFYRECKCGQKHQNKFIRGMFKYSDEAETAFCVALLEHKQIRHIWLSFITGEWPNTNESDCAVTSHICLKNGGIVFTIHNGEESPFIPADIFNCYQVTREQIMDVDGAKDWFINTYLSLFETDYEIGNYL